ncbi:MAG: hypothetical protein K0U68_08790 [Gammaproteobacteria bacterium]|nr:hypothetical protein [Gammaproteobacteria bacterium]
MFLIGGVDKRQEMYLRIQRKKALTPAICNDLRRSANQVITLSEEEWVLLNGGGS